MKLVVAVILLLAVLISTVSSGPIAFKGKENVFKYEIKVGTHCHLTNSFHQGFAISTHVVVKKKADDTFHVQLNNVEVRCSKDKPLDKEKIAALEANLAIPFDYNPKEDKKSLTVYAPETVDSESTNLKRGLLSVLEFYDSDTKKVSRVATEGASGHCEEIEVKQGEVGNDVEFIRSSNLETNCKNGRPHTIVHKGGVSCQGTYCSAEPKVNRAVSYKIVRSKDGSDQPKIVVKGTENLKLHSLFQDKMFSDLQAKTHLELVKIQDASAEESHSGEATQSCLEVRIESERTWDQAALLARAQAGFKALDDALLKLDTDTHLEDHDATTVLLGVLKSMKFLNKESLKTLYQSLGQSLQPSFFQLLGLSSSPAALDVVIELYSEVLESPDDNVHSISNAVPRFFEAIDAKQRHIPVDKVWEMIAFYKKLNELDKSHDRLHHSVALAASRVMYELCFSRKGKMDEKCPSEEEVITKLTTDIANADEHQLRLKVKVLANMGLVKGIPMVKSILDDKSKHTNLRTEAAWSLMKQARKDYASVKPIITHHFYDREEDHEIRIALYVTAAKFGPLNELMSMVQYLVDNSENEDRQVLTYVISSSRAMKDHKVPEGSKCPQIAERARAVWDGVLQNVAECLGSKDLFDSSLYAINSADGKDSFMASVIANKRDILPRSLFFMLRDPLQSRAFSIKTVSDGMVYGNLVQLKKAMDEFKKVNKVEVPAIKAELEKVFARVTPKIPAQPTEFSMTFSFIRDGNEVTFETFEKPEELIQRIIEVSMGQEKNVRTYNMLNKLVVKSHTESGLRVKFMTVQATVNSYEIPSFDMGQMGRTGLPISFRYGAKALNRVIYGTFACLPESKFLYINGKVSDKNGQIPRNVSLLFMNKVDEGMSTTMVKVRSDPLSGVPEKDVFVRSLRRIQGNVEDMKDWKKLLVKCNDPHLTKSYGHDHFGLGIKVTRSANYIRPNLLEGPLSRFCPHYQEIDSSNTDPFIFKVAVSKCDHTDHPHPLSYDIVFAKGQKEGKYFGFFHLSFQSPKNPDDRSIRFGFGKTWDLADFNKRQFYVQYENTVSEIYDRGHATVTMPENKGLIPEVTKLTSDWLSIYPTEKILLDAKHKIGPTGRKAYSADDLNDLLNGIGDDIDIRVAAEFYRTEEQAELYKAMAAKDESRRPSYYDILMRRTTAHPRNSILAWDRLLRFHGYKAKATFLKPLPDSIRSVHRKMRFLMIQRHYKNMEYDIKGKLSDTEMEVSLNSTVDNKRTDLVIKDKIGTQSFLGFESKWIPLFRPTSSPIRVFYHNTFNLPICTLSSSDGKTEVESFDGRDIPTEGLSGDCEHLLMSNCRGKKNFAITYNKAKDTFTILYDSIHKIVLHKDSIEVDGTSHSADKQGLITKVDEIVVVSYKGILGVVLPNRVKFVREAKSSAGHVIASRLFKGRTCGLCGDMDGNGANDGISAVKEFAVSGSCAA